MGLIKCPDCGRTISDHLDVCPGCGYHPKGRNFYPGKPKPTAIPVRCPWCGKMVPAGQKTCPGCGSPAKVTYSMAPRRLRPVELDHTAEDGGSKKRRPAWLLPLLASLLAALLVLAAVRAGATLRRSRSSPVPEPTEEMGGTVSEN